MIPSPVNMERFCSVLQEQTELLGRFLIHFAKMEGLCPFFYSRKGKFKELYLPCGCFPTSLIWEMSVKIVIRKSTVRGNSPLKSPFQQGCAANTQSYLLT